MTDSPSTTGRQQRNTPVNNNNNSRHINFIWPKLSEVTYERHFPGQSVQVAGPTETDPVVTIESSLLLKTASLEQVLPLYKKCSQYEHKGGCEKGPLCKYIHAVHIDTSLEKRKRFRRTTPNPGRLGELSVMTTTDLSATCCSTGGDCDFEMSPHAPPPPAILTLPTPSVPQKGGWWYRDPYSQRRIHIAAPPSTFEAFTSSVTYIP